MNNNQQVSGMSAIKLLICCVGVAILFTKFQCHRSMVKKIIEPSQKVEYFVIDFFDWLLQTNSWLLKDIVPKLSRRGQNAKMSDECRFLLTGMIQGFSSRVYTTKSNPLPHVTNVNDPISKPQTPLMALGKE